MVSEGLIMLSEKKSPRYMQDRLNSFLDPKIHFNIDTQVRR
jgi:chemotaxis protein MotA